jgi:hypothetical protein
VPEREGEQLADAYGARAFHPGARD